MFLFNQTATNILSVSSDYSMFVRNLSANSSRGSRRSELASLLEREREVGLGNGEVGSGGSPLTVSSEDLSLSTRSASPRYNSTLIEEK